MRFLVLAIAVAALAFGLLYAFEALPFGLGSSARSGAQGDAPDLRGEGGEDDAELRLEGRGVRRPADGTEDGSLAGTGHEAEMASEVHGGRPGGASIVGRVVAGESRVPLAGAQVALTHPDILFHYLRADPQGRFDELNAMTDAEGHFAFRDVVPAKGYAVRVRARGQAALSVEDIDLRGRAAKDLGDLVLGPKGRVKGRVVDGEGTPIAGARVVATWYLKSPLQIVLTDPDTVKEIEADVVTDDKGAFVLDDLEPGRKTLVVDAHAMGRDVVWRVDVSAGQDADVGDVVMASKLALAGRLEWEDGKPIAGARIFGGLQNQHAVDTVETAADGTWRLEPVPEGEFTIGVLVPGLPVHIEDGVEGGRTDVVIRLPVTGSIRGRVVRAQGGTPVEAFGVYLEPAEKEGWRERMVRMIVDNALGARPFQSKEGRFALERVLPGRYTVQVEAEGHPPTASEVVTVEAGQEVEVRISLPEGSGVRGTVLDTSGEPVQGARVYVMPEVSQLEGSAPDELEVWAEDQDVGGVTDAEGTFTLPPLSPGVVHLVAIHEDHLATIRRGLRLSGGPVEGVELRMPQAGGMTGTVLDDRGRPAGEVEIGIACEDGRFHRIDTDADGHFEWRPVVPGRYLVFWASFPRSDAIAHFEEAENEGARREAWEVLRQWGPEVQVIGGEPAEVSLRLPRRTRVKGMLRVDGVPASREQGVWITAGDGRRGRFIRCTEDGTFEMLLGAGAYVFYAPNKEQYWTGTEVEVPDAYEFRLELGR